MATSWFQIVSSGMFLAGAVILLITVLIILLNKKVAGKDGNKKWIPIIIAVVCFIAGWVMLDIRDNYSEDTNKNYVAEKSYTGDGVLICPQCGDKCDQSKDYCSNCGYKFKIYCYNCGSEISKDWKYCEECGVRLWRPDCSGRKNLSKTERINLEY